MEGRPREAILRAAPYSAPLLATLAGLDRSAGLAYLTGLAAGYAQRAAEVSIESVWNGPGSHHVGPRHLRAVLDAYVAHYNRRRPHRARGLRPPDGDDITLAPATDLAMARIRRREVLGGLIHEYERAA